jgi:hypothetical protein
MNRDILSAEMTRGCQETTPLFFYLFTANDAVNDLEM